MCNGFVSQKPVRAREGHAVVIRSIAWLGLVIGMGAVSCVRLDKPKDVAACAALNNCSDNPLPPGTGGTAGRIVGSGGATGAATGGSAAGGATIPGSGGAGPGGSTSPDAPGAGGITGSGGSAVDAAAGGAGATGMGGIKVETGGTAGAGAAPVTGGTVGTGGAGRTGGARGSGGAVGSGGKTGTGGAIGTGGVIGTGGSVRDAGVDVPPDANPLLTGLMVYYSFESATGTAIPDLSGKGNTGKITIGTLPDGSTPTATGYEFVSGKVGKALSIHKAGVGYVIVPNAVFANTTDLTIAVWANVTTTQNWQRLVDVGINAKLAQNSQTGTKYMNLVPKNDGSNMLFSITTNGYGSEQMLSSAQVAASTWTHLAVVLAAGAGGRLYVNGIEANANASLTLRASDLGAVDYAFIGRSQFTSDPAFDGIVDEFRVYNRALTAAEILALYSFTGS